MYSLSAPSLSAPLDFSAGPAMMPGVPWAQGLAQQRLQPAACSSCVTVGMLSTQLTMQSMLLEMMSLLMGLMVNSPARATSSTFSSGASGQELSSAAPVTASSSVQASGGPKVQKLIDAALSKQGTPYVFGAAGPDKFDCSGLVSWALKQAGSNVPRLTAEGLRKHYASSSLGRNELKPGDLVFFWSPNDRGIPKGQATHVEIYLGDGKTMGTDSAKEGARVEPINWDTFIGGARPPELQG